MVVDLNEAYNPWCAYGDNHACRLVLSGEVSSRRYWARREEIPS